jgi:hypothetical protein
MFILWIDLLLAFAAGMAAMWRANYLFDRIIDEVNARSEPNDRIQAFRVRRWQMRGFIDRHKRLYPQSGLRSRYHRWLAIGIGLWLVTMFCLFAVQAAVSRRGSA